MKGVFVPEREVDPTVPETKVFLTSLVLPQCPLIESVRVGRGGHKHTNSLK